MNSLNSFRDVISLWPTPSLTNLASELKLSYGRVKKWWRRDSIPSEHWQAMVDAAASRHFDQVTFEALGRIAAAPRKSPDDAHAQSTPQEAA